MEKINIKKLCEAIKTVCNKAPITYIDETLIIFLGERVEIAENEAKSLRFEFNFNNQKTFIESLRNYGLMLSQWEIYKILQEYGIEDTE